jgi:hypothetical protein
MHRHLSYITPISPRRKGLIPSTITPLPDVDSSAGFYDLSVCSVLTILTWVGQPRCVSAFSSLNGAASKQRKLLGARFAQVADTKSEQPQRT